MSALRKRKEQTRIQILFAAYQLFTANGFEATTVDAIALQAGVSRKTLFNYFPSKNQLLWEIARDWYEQSPGLPSPEEAGKPALVLLRDIFMDQLHLLEQHRSFMQIVLRHSNGMDIDKALLHPGQAIEDRCMAEALGLFHLAEQRGELLPGVSAETAYHVYAALRNLVVRRWLLLTEPDPNLLIVEAKCMLSVFFNGCAVHPPADLAGI